MEVELSSDTLVITKGSIGLLQMVREQADAIYEKGKRIYKKTRMLEKSKSLRSKKIKIHNVIKKEGKK